MESFYTLSRKGYGMQLLTFTTVTEWYMKMSGWNRPPNVSAARHKLLSAVFFYMDLQCWTGPQEFHCECCHDIDIATQLHYLIHGWTASIIWLVQGRTANYMISQAVRAESRGWFTSGPIAIVCVCVSLCLNPKHYQWVRERGWWPPKTGHDNNRITDTAQRHWAEAATQTAQLPRNTITQGLYH